MITYQPLRLLLALCITGLLTMLCFVLLVPTASAQTVELDGYAWSSNIGWISFNCRTGGNNQSNICGTSNYQVAVNGNNLSGYAWSSNIGWIRFGGLSGFPNGSGTNGNNARVTGAYPNYQLNGWARACSVFQSNCSGSLRPDHERGGWDGWISLRGTNYSISTANYGSPQYAWGSEVIGWIDMSTHAELYTPAFLTGTNCTAGDGQSTCQGTLSWNIPTNVTTPNVRRNTPNPAEIATNYTGTSVQTPLTVGVTNEFVIRDGNTVLINPPLQLSANCASDSSVVEGVCLPDLTLSIVPEQRLIRRGETPSFVISSDPESPADTCSLNGGDIAQDIPPEGIIIDGPGPIYNTTRYTFNCRGVIVRTSVDVVPSIMEI